MTRNIFRFAATAVLAAFMLAAVSCGGSNPPKTASNVIDEFGEMIVSGDSSWGPQMGQLSAESYDAGAQQLVNVRLETEQLIVTAERADIIINSRFNTITARLLSPQGALTDGGSPQDLGDDMESASVPVPYNVQD